MSDMQVRLCNIAMKAPDEVLRPVIDMLSWSLLLNGIDIDEQPQSEKPSLKLRGLLSGSKFTTEEYFKQKAEDKRLEGILE